jgi:imidazolonepropionase
MAVATDLNPGSSPLNSLLLAMNMACTLFGLTPEEAFRGVTVNGARALGLAGDRGTLEEGKMADLALWEVGHPRELAYWVGGHPCKGVVKNGVPTASNASAFPPHRRA